MFDVLIEYLPLPEGKGEVGRWQMTALRGVLEAAVREELNEHLTRQLARGDVAVVARPFDIDDLYVPDLRITIYSEPGGNSCLQQRHDRIKQVVAHQVMTWLRQQGSHVVDLQVRLVWRTGSSVRVNVATTLVATVSGPPGSLMHVGDRLTV